MKRKVRKDKNNRKESLLNYLKEISDYYLDPDALFMHTLIFLAIIMMLMGRIDYDGQFMSMAYGNVSQTFNQLNQKLWVIGTLHDMGKQPRTLEAASVVFFIILCIPLFQIYYKIKKRSKNGKEKRQNRRAK